MKTKTVLTWVINVILTTALSAQYNYDDSYQGYNDFIDISSTGVNLHLADDGYADIDIPFVFDLDGDLTSYFRIFNNGAMFIVRNHALNTNNFGLTDYLENGIYPFWDDLGPSNSGVYWEVQGAAPNRKLIVLWKDMPHYSLNNNNYITFEVIIHESGVIQFIYMDLVFGDSNYDYGASATIGIKGHNGPYQYSYNTSIGPSVYGIEWTRPNPHHPGFSVTVQPDCDYDEYYVHADVFDMGGSSTIYIEDDQNISAFAISQPNQVIMGPYINGSSVEIIARDSSGTYSSSRTVQYFCPPDNDDCLHAESIASLPYGMSGIDARGSTNNNGSINVCSPPVNDGVWYKMVVGQANGDINISVSNVSGDWNPAIQVYSGTDCSHLTCVAQVNNNGHNSGETLSFTPTSGTTYYINIGSFGSIDWPEGIFTLNISGNSVLKITGASKNIFTLYPNPANDVIYWNTDEIVNTIRIYDFSGKLILRKDEPGQKMIDISRIPAGLYQMAVTMGTKTYYQKFVKK